MEEFPRTTLARLPLRGLVALAAKCARRAQPVFRDWNNGCGDQQHEQAVEAAIGYAEAFATGTQQPHELCGEGDRLEAAADAAALAASNIEAFFAGNAAETAAMASRAAINASDSVQGMGPFERGRFAQSALVVTWEAVQRMILSFPTQQERAASRDAAVADFNALLAWNLGEFPQVGNPVRL